MNSNLILEIAVWAIVIASIFRVLASIDYLRVVRFALREVLVKNGLERLRKQLLVSSITLFFINTFGLSLLILRPFTSPEIYQQITNILSILNSIGFWVIGRINVSIYTQQYTPEQKHNHEMIDKLERGEVKLVSKRKGR